VRVTFGGVDLGTFREALVTVGGSKSEANARDGI
jgi:hypothetical protein